MTVCVRFAPSPTGFLHIGGVRTALYNWLYARRHGGKYLIRIEDTDRERSREECTQDILDSLQWLGLTGDEPPVFQSQRGPLYQAAVDEMLLKGSAYRCTCTAEEIEVMREEARKKGEKPMYNGLCRERRPADHDPTRPAAIRIKIPRDGKVAFQDQIHGEIAVDNAELDDFVIMRSTGDPTYNLVVVVDDHHMQITHVIRGDDHINNTSKQIHVYRALGWAVPAFAHLPMILGEDKKKLSKRHGTVSATVYREEGYLPQALLNFLVRLGWSHGDQEIISLEEMTRHFGFDHASKSAAVFNTEKLQWLNAHYLRLASAQELTTHLETSLGKRLSADSALKSTLKSRFGQALLELLKPKAKVLGDFLDQMQAVSHDGLLEVDLQQLKWQKNPALKAPTIQALTELLGHLQKTAVNYQSAPDFCLADAGVNHDGLSAFVTELAKKHQLKLGDLMPPLRLCVTGPALGVGLFDILPIIPWKRLQPRLEQAVKL